MKKVICAAILAAALSLGLANGARASNASMLFWYPGEAGSTMEAQPILDDFLAYVSRKMGDVNISGRYYNTVEEGLKYIEQHRPAVGIVSFAALSQYGAKIGESRVMLATLPLPMGTQTAKYTLMGKSGKISPGATVLSSEPMSAEFVRTSLFPKMPADAVIRPTGQMLSALKRISAGELDALAILTPVEAIAVSRLKAAWTAGLTTIETSESVPTARVLLLDPSWKDAEKLRKVLVGAAADPEAREILTELRLKGFAEAR